MPFQKGQSGNPSGKRKGEFRKMMEAALAAESKAKGMSLIRHAVKKAYEDNSVLIAILKKILPDLKAVDVALTQESPFRLIIDLSPKTVKQDKKSKAVDRPFLTRQAIQIPQN